MVVVQVERFVQAPLPAVDLLFVVDGTGSMAQEIDALQAGITDLVASLDGLELDWHLGVVSADADAPWSGWLLGSPYVLTSAHPDPVGAFAERLPRDLELGEQGLAAAVLALEEGEASGANAGFFRPDARLNVVFVSDADDHSAGDATAAFLEALALRAPEATASALVGDVPGGCTSDNGSAQAGERYASVVEATGGQLGSICSATFSDLLADLGSSSFSLPYRFTLRTAPVENVTVTIDGVPTDAFSVDGLDLVFEEPPPSGSRIEVRYVVREEEAP